MNKSVDNDIIVALATPYGRSAIAAIRISGKDCIKKVQPLLSKSLVDGQLKYNKFICEGFNENMMAVCYRAPKSYSGEDTVELFPHGNMTICDGIIKTLLAIEGIRVAEKGEFTKRAFMNGKLDLMQCEALADIIDAQTPEQLEYGNKRYNGGFAALDEAEKLLKKALSTVEAVIHYGDELEQNEIDESILNDVFGSLDKISELLGDEIAKFAGGRIVNDGFKLALIGAPNVGKSTLLNALVGSDRAIVTPIAGTTRDTIDADFVYNGKKFTVIDTAGLNDDTVDEVEKIGIDRARAAAESADAVILVTAGDDSPIYINENGEKTVKVINKCDDVKEVGVDFEKASKDGELMISAKNGKNITALKEKLYSLCPKEVGGICNHRQYACVLRCLDCVIAAKKERDKEEGLEIVAAALFDAYSAITELYGETADENIIGEVFERFCVGK